MANLKELRQRIASVKSTQQVTKAMKMVSASKLRRAQDAIVQIRPYSGKLHDILVNVLSGVQLDIPKKFSERKEVNNVLIVAFSSNRGLCGAFNSNVVKKVSELYFETYKPLSLQNKVKVLAIGKKAADTLKSRNIPVSECYTNLNDAPSYLLLSEIASTIMESYGNNEIDKIEIVYNQFKNAGVQNVVCDQFLPVNISGDGTSSKKLNKYQNNYLFEPTESEIIEHIIPKTLKLQFYKALLDSIASEHGARMTTMHKATDNCAKMIKSLSLIYNKQRQASITNEILEIVGGFNAIKHN